MTTPESFSLERLRELMAADKPTASSAVTNERAAVHQYLYLHADEICALADRLQEVETALKIATPYMEQVIIESKGPVSEGERIGLEKVRHASRTRERREG